MPQPKHVSRLPIAQESDLDEDLQVVWSKCKHKLGLVPNVLQAYSFKPQRLRNFMALYNELMLGESGLSKLDREMIAVVVSAQNRCYYCLVAHGSAVRELSGDPQLGEMLAFNYRVAELSERHRAMLDFAVALTDRPAEIEEADREALRAAGFDDSDIFDIGETVAFFNFSNRMAYALDMMPNEAYHEVAR